MLDALALPGRIRKVRHHVSIGPHLWEIDEFEGDNAGLVVAEVELDREDQAIDLPPWVCEEVTHDPRYFNSNLALQPFQRWSR